MRRRAMLSSGSWGYAIREKTFDVVTAPDHLGRPAPQQARPGGQNTAWPLIRLGSQVEKNGIYVTMLIALKIAR